MSKNNQMAKFVLTDVDRAEIAFEIENGVEPARQTAQRIAAKYGGGENHPLVDDISRAIEDAWGIGWRRHEASLAARRLT